MQRTWFVLMLAAVVAVSSIVGCSGDAGGPGDDGSPPDTAPADGDVSAELPGAFEAAGGGASLTVSADGGAVSVACGDAVGAVSVPGGAAPEGASWTVTPLASPPSGVERPLCPGIFVSTNGAEPTDWCAVGFSLPTTASPDATIVRLGDDGSVAEIVPTARMDLGGRTILTAYVKGFSAYTTAEEDAAARDAAFVERAKARGQEVDWTIKVIGTETHENMGWKFTYDLDLFASGGDVGVGGVYKGHALLSMTGEYQESMGVVQSFGDVSGGVRDDDLTFVIVDAALADLLTGQDVEGSAICGSGYLSGQGFGNLNLFATGPTASGEYHTGPVEGGEPVAFDIYVTTGEDVQVEIKDVGIFPGKILRTSR